MLASWDGSAPGFYYTPIRYSPGTPFLAPSAFALRSLYPQALLLFPVACFCSVYDPCVIGTAAPKVIFEGQVAPLTPGL